jgi:RimJ/RimL family protein N-acetyltransferase
MTPTLRTERLILSGHQPDDLPALAAIWCDPEVYRHIGGQERGREEVWLRMLRHVGQWTLFGRGMWVVRDRETGAVLGEAGLMDGRREMTPPLPEMPEAGWTLASAAHGRGLGREAMTAALAWADAEGHPKSCCIIDPGNAPSIRLAGRLGYVPAGTSQYHGRPVAVMTRG